jgi:hypothetical protein
VEDFLEGFGGGFEEEVEEVEEVAAFAEDAAEDFEDGEDELAVRDFVADGGGDPIGDLADAALVAGGAEVSVPEVPVRFVERASIRLKPLVLDGLVDSTTVTTPSHA